MTNAYQPHWEFGADGHGGRRLPLGHIGPSKQSCHERGKDLLTVMSSFYDVSTSSFNMLFFINSIVSSSWFSSARFNACRNAFFALENSPIKDKNLILKLWSHSPFLPITTQDSNEGARGNFVFDQSVHLLTFEGLDQSEGTMTACQCRKLWEAVGKTSPPNIVFLTVVIQLWTYFISLHQSLVNLETFCRCNFRSTAFFKRNRF